MSTNPHAAITPHLVSLNAADGTTVLVDVEHGGRLASLVIGGRERLLGAAGAPPGSIRWGSFLMAPWPGRLADGRLRWRGRTWQLPRTHGRHAIHGLVHDRPWTVTEASGAGISLEIELGPAGWPFGGRVRQQITLEPGGLTLDAEIEADKPMPAALGWHPWFDRAGTDPRVTVTADRVLELAGMIPTGETIAVAGRTDLRDGPRLGRRRLDDAYTDARSPAVIAWPDLELRLEFGPPVTTVVVHTPAQAFCVEPQTAWPNALGVGADLARQRGAASLGAGETLRARLRLRIGGPGRPTLRGAPESPPPSPATGRPERAGPSGIAK